MEFQKLMTRPAAKHKQRKKASDTSKNSILSMISEIGCPPEPDFDLSYEQIAAGVYVDRLIASYNLRHCFEKGVWLMYNSSDESKDSIRLAITPSQVREFRDAVVEWSKIRESVIESIRSSGLEHITEAVQILRHSIEEQQEGLKQREL